MTRWLPYYAASAFYLACGVAICVWPCSRPAMLAVLVIAFVPAMALCVREIRRLNRVLAELDRARAVRRARNLP